MVRFALNCDNRVLHAEACARAEDDLGSGEFCTQSGSVDRVEEAKTDRKEGRGNAVMPYDLIQNVEVLEQP